MFSNTRTCAGRCGVCVCAAESKHEGYGTEEIDDINPASTNTDLHSGSNVGAVPPALKRRVVESAVFGTVVIDLTGSDDEHDLSADSVEEISQHLRYIDAWSRKHPRSLSGQSKAVRT